MFAFRPNRRHAALLIAASALVVGAFVFFRPQKECRANQVAAPAAAGKPTSGGAPETKEGKARQGAGQPVAVEVMVVGTEELVTPVPATGTLLPRESITVVSELSRRLLKTHVKEGGRVKKGDLLFTLDASDLTAERARLAVQRQYAARNSARHEELFAQSVASEAEADQARSALSEIDASQQVLSVTLGKTSIRAPFDGVLGLRRVSEGAWVTPSTPLITLSDTSRLKIDFNIPERHASAIGKGNEFEIRVDGQDKPFIGTVAATEPSIDQASRSLVVRGEVESDGALLPGMFAKVEIRVKKTDAILLPTIAIIPGVSGRGVYVEREGQAHLVPVELGSRTPDRVQVLSGLSVGDRVIVSNLLRLRDGIGVVIASKANEPRP